MAVLVLQRNIVDWEENDVNTSCSKIHYDEILTNSSLKKKSTGRVTIDQIDIHILCWLNRKIVSEKFLSVTDLLLL